MSKKKKRSFFKRRQKAILAKTEAGVTEAAAPAPVAELSAQLPDPPKNPHSLLGDDVDRSKLPPMMGASYVDLDRAIEDFKHAPPVPKVEYPEDADHFEWQQTGFWGGYHEQADEITQNKRRAEVKREEAELEYQQKLKDQKASQKEEESDVDKHLGQNTQYSSEYDPSILVREPRQSNRTHLDIVDGELPFTGYDLWNAYELSCLTKDGLPISATGKILYPCNSKYLVESKSLKLYFNSFNMTQLGSSPESALGIMEHTIQTDLSELLQTDVTVKLKLASDPFTQFKATDIWGQNMIFNTGDRLMPCDTFVTLETAVKDLGTVDQYTEDPSLLKKVDKGGNRKNLYYHSSLLKSNCKVTHQPDWGDVFIYMNAADEPDLPSLLKYIVSFRNENHFHEEICETIFKRLQDVYEPAVLGVTCLYVRRGGIDINPTRISTGQESMLGLLHSPDKLVITNSHIKLTRQ